MGSNENIDREIRKCSRIRPFLYVAGIAGLSPGVLSKWKRSKIREGEEKGKGGQVGTGSGQTTSQMFWTASLVSSRRIIVVWRERDT